MTPIRWGILGTANIAKRAFLPALRQTDGVPARVGSRSPERGQAWAAENGLDGAASYEQLIAADDLDAIYIALPNDEHVPWTARAIAAGKAVLCEKPLGLDSRAVRDLVATIGPDARAWEAFVFPFHPQSALIAGLIADGAIGDAAQIVSEFHFALTATENIRLNREQGGGALFDVGCYPIRLGRLLFGEAVAGAGIATNNAGGVDVDSAGVLDFGPSQRLVWSAGFRRPASTFSRIVGTEAELRVSNPFHPTASDSVQLWRDGELKQSWTPAPGAAFEHAIRHIHDVLREGAAPRYRISDDGIGQAAAMDLARSTLLVR